MSPGGASSAPLRLAPGEDDRNWQRLWRESITDPRQLLGSSAWTLTRKTSWPRTTRVSACAYPPDSSRACATAIPTTRCSCRSCRSRPNWTAPPGSPAMPSATSTRRQHRHLSQVRGPRAAGRYRRVRGALPLLLSPPFSLCAEHRSSKPLARSHRAHLFGYIDRGSHPLRRRSVVPGNRPSCRARTPRCVRQATCSVCAFIRAFPSCCPSASTNFATG